MPTRTRLETGISWEDDFLSARDRGSSRGLTSGELGAACELDDVSNCCPLCPPEAAAAEASIASRPLLPGQAAPVPHAETAVGGKALDEDMTCEMILNMMVK